MAPVFNSKRASAEWTRLVDDLLAASTAGNSQSTEVGALKERYQKLEVAINVAPSKLIDKQLKTLAKGLDKKLSEVAANSDPAKTLKDRKAIRDELRKMERSLLKNALQAQTTMGKALLQDSARKQKESQKRFARDTKENAQELQKVLSKQLLEVNEERGLSDSEGLKRLERDLAEGLRALRVDDFKRFQELSENLRDVKSNYGVTEDTSEKLNDIEELVKESLERKKNRRAKYDEYAERASDSVGIGGLYRGARSVVRGTKAVYRGVRSVKNAAYRGVRKASSTLRATSPKKASSASILTKLFGTSSDRSKDASQDREDSSLLRRQVAALESISNTSKGRRASGGNAQGFNWKNLLSGLKLGKLASMGAKFLGPILGKLGLLGAAAFAGWNIGSYVYDKFASEIQDGIEVIVGIVKKGLDFAAQGFDWFKKFLDSPLEGVRKIGGTLKDAWDKSVFAKFFKNPGTVMQEGLESLMKYTAPAAKKGEALVMQGKAEAEKAANSAISNVMASVSQGSAEAKSVISKVQASSSAAVSSGYSSVKDALGKLFKAGPNVDMENLNPAVKQNFLSMAEEYKARGGTGMIQVNSAARSSADQARLFKQDPSKAAPPGRSSHERGLAIDINRAEANKMDAMGLLSKYGFSRPVRGEPWHLQAKGTASMLASKGIFSSDNPSSQGMATSPKTASSAAPVVASVKNPSQTVENGLTSTLGQTVPPLRASGPTFQGSVASIPTFSYVDNGFFLMNAGVLGG
jgi:D-alanyl-D-alanine carboxypeptidase